jgi:hypothetical protein
MLSSRGWHMTIYIHKKNVGHFNVKLEHLTLSAQETYLFFDIWFCLGNVA